MPCSTTKRKNPQRKKYMYNCRKRINTKKPPSSNANGVCRMILYMGTQFQFPGAICSRNIIVQPPEVTGDYFILQVSQ